MTLSLGEASAWALSSVSSGDETRLYLNHNLQFSSRDEYRYHEALVHPGLAALPGARRVLVLGGGDGMAVREILKYPQVESIVLVDLDPRMTELFAGRRTQGVTLFRVADGEQVVSVAALEDEGEAGSDDGQTL